MMGFLIRFLVLYVLLMIPWPGVESTYRNLFVGTGDVLYRALGSGYGVRFDETKVVGKGEDTAITVRHQAARVELQLGINSREIGYLATVVIISLCVATPSAWRRRLRALLIGLGIVHVFIAMRPLVLILYSANADLQMLSGAVAASSGDKAFSAVVQFFGVGQPLSYIVPIIVWIVVAVRRDALAEFFPELGHQEK